MNRRNLLLAFTIAATTLVVPSLRSWASCALPVATHDNPPNWPDGTPPNGH